MTGVEAEKRAPNERFSDKRGAREQRRVVSGAILFGYVLKSSKQRPIVTLRYVTYRNVTTDLGYPNMKYTAQVSITATYFSRHSVDNVFLFHGRGAFAVDTHERHNRNPSCTYYATRVERRTGFFPNRRVYLIGVPTYNNSVQPSM